ncbi:MAG: hypothetical protein E6J41_27870 [Chloroflexi bacterium]|nr:MAG: hypothetical protein E6J41_27870 [Chloroflexota bacterium]
MPGDVSFSGAGYERVGSEVTCVITRFQLRSVWDLLRLHRLYRQVRRDARQRCSGLLHAGFLVEGPRTFYSFTLWRDDAAILEFGTVVQSHIRIAGRGLRATFRADVERPEIWSTQWKLTAVSENLNWEEVDVRSLVTTP